MEQSNQDRRRPAARSIVFWGLAACVLQASPPSGDAQSAGAEPTRAQLARLGLMQGRFTYAEASGAAASLREAIAEATAGLEGPERLAQRARLEVILTPERHLSLALVQGNEGGVQLAFQEGRADVQVPLTGQAQAVRNHGNTELQVSQHMQGNVLVQVIEGLGLRQERRLSLSADGQTLTVQLKVTGTQLGAPIELQRRYLRAS